MELLIGHSPDPDDAFMFYALKRGLVKAPFTVREFLVDIETLNKLAIHGRIDVTAVSTHAMAYIGSKYYILRVGASMGLRYGPPVVVGNTARPELVAVPGTYTTATLLVKLAMPNVKTVEIPFDKIMDAVKAGVVDAGALIHEGQITYERYGLKKIMDLGEWWYEETKLPTPPLGLDVVKASLGIDVAKAVKEALLESIRYAMSHREEALSHAMEFSRGLNISDTDKFVRMYVNEYTMDMGIDGEKSIQVLLEMGHERGLLPEPQLLFI
ncbi:MqnA/MqnD/SBP family protein [Vulcanisaeta distributa]|uniref:menaquinone biosynthesis family protein n=1 Tax=Vulcanisaeta distributa TaxID=164451 RepID=UPI0006D1D21D|nr:MqnA/MqnD/SBP family protein [Vulcanisaeta distributa]